MDLFWVHDPYQESSNCRLGETKGKCSKWKPQDCVEDGILLFVDLKRVKMSAVSVFNGEDGDTDTTPLEYLRLVIRRRGMGS